MTQTTKQVRQLNSLKWSIPVARDEREMEVSSFGTPELQLLVADNFEADTWAEGRYYAKS